jgi:hypothetical protein
LSDYERHKNMLVNIMDKYDSPHPLRGPAYDHIKPGKLAFKKKVVGIVSGDNAYQGYKKDNRKTLETSKMLSDETIKEYEEHSN